MLGSIDRSRGVSVAEALNTKFGTARFPYLVPANDRDKVRDKDKDSDANNHTRIGVGRRPILTSRTGHLSKLKHDLPTNRPRAMGLESM